MKYTAFLSLALILISCSGTSDSEIGNKTTMEVSPTVFEAGDVLLGEKITAKFVVKNTGSYPLVISEAKGSCSCTVADYPKEPVAPGETGVVLAHVDTEATGVGALNKTVNIVANTENSVTTVVIRAAVMKK
jgi:hypothetical protein